MLKDLKKLSLKSTPGSETGASFVEYALLVAFIAVVCVSAATAVGNAVGNEQAKTGAFYQVVQEGFGGTGGYGTGDPPPN